MHGTSSEAFKIPLHIQLHYHWRLQVLPVVVYFQKHIVMEFAAFHFFCSFHHWEDISKLKTVLICKNIDKVHHYQLLVLHIQKEHLVYCLCAYYVSIAKGSYLPISWNNWSLCRLLKIYNQTQLEFLCWETESTSMLGCCVAFITHYRR